MQNVFANSATIVKRDRVNLQLNLLELFSNALQEVDWKFLIDVAPKIIRDLKNFNGIFDSLIPGVQLTLKCLYCIIVAVINYLFENKTFSALFKLVNIGVDSVNESGESAALVSHALGLINSLLRVQNFYKQVVTNIAKQRYNYIVQPLGYGLL